MDIEILYSPGYGAGWVSWYCGTDEQKLFMATYKPMMDALFRGWRYQDPGFDRPQTDPVVLKFISDWEDAGFSLDDLPYFGGLRDLRTMRVGGPFRITEYDGFESVEELGDTAGYLFPNSHGERE